MSRDIRSTSALPYITLESVMDKLNTKYWYSSLQEKDEQQYTETIEALIARAPMPIKAVLGNSSISVNDFLGLQVGDIIRLDTKWMRICRCMLEI